MWAPLLFHSLNMFRTSICELPQTMLSEMAHKKSFSFVSHCTIHFSDLCAIPMHKLITFCCYQLTKLYDKFPLLLLMLISLSEHFLKGDDDDVMFSCRFPLVSVALPDAHDNLSLTSHHAGTISTQLDSYHIWANSSCFLSYTMLQICVQNWDIL